MFVLLLALHTAVADVPPAKPEKPVCRAQVATGSIMPLRVCKTRAQWAAIDRAADHDRQNPRNNTMNPSQGSPLSPTGQ